MASSARERWFESRQLNGYWHIQEAAWDWRQDWHEFGRKQGGRAKRKGWLSFCQGQSEGSRLMRSQQWSLNRMSSPPSLPPPLDSPDSVMNNEFIKSCSPHSCKEDEWGRGKPGPRDCMCKWCLECPGTWFKANRSDTSWRLLLPVPLRGKPRPGIQGLSWIGSCQPLGPFCLPILSPTEQPALPSHEELPLHAAFFYEARSSLGVSLCFHPLPHRCPCNELWAFLLTCALGSSPLGGFWWATKLDVCPLWHLCSEKLCRSSVIVTVLFHIRLALCMPPSLHFCIAFVPIFICHNDTFKIKISTSRGLLDLNIDILGDIKGVEFLWNPHFFNPGIFELLRGWEMKNTYLQRRETAQRWRHLSCMWPTLVHMTLKYLWVLPWRSLKDSWEMLTRIHCPINLKRSQIPGILGRKWDKVCLVKSTPVIRNSRDSGLYDFSGAPSTTNSVHQ